MAAPTAATTAGAGDGYNGAVPEKLFSDELDEWLRSDTPKTLGAMNDVFDERSFAVAILLLMFPSALPVPTGGVTHVLEAVTLLLAFQIVAGREEVWVPRRWRQRELGETLTGKAIPFIVRRVRSFERFSRNRMAPLFERGWFLRLLGVFIVVFTLGSILAPPFSGLDTLPALGVVLITLGMILRDVTFTVAGAVVGCAGVLLIITLGEAAVRLFQRLF
jgi:hypothetical protein